VGRIYENGSLYLEALRHAAAARDGNERIVFRVVGAFLHGLKMHARQRSDDFKVAQFFRADVHQEIFAFGIVTPMGEDPPGASGAATGGE